MKSSAFVQNEFFDDLTFITQGFLGPLQIMSSKEKNGNLRETEFRQLSSLLIIV